MIETILIFLIILAAAFAVGYYLLRGRKKDEWLWVGPGEDPFKKKEEEEEEEEMDEFYPTMGQEEEEE